MLFGLDSGEILRRCMFLNTEQCVAVRGMAYSDVGDYLDTFVSSLKVGERFTLSHQSAIVYGDVYDVVYNSDRNVGRVAFHHCERVGRVSDSHGRTKATFMFGFGRNIILKLCREVPKDGMAAEQKPLVTDMNLICKRLLLKSVPEDKKMRNMAYDILYDTSETQMLPLLQRYSRICCQSVAREDICTHLQVLHRVREAIIDLINSDAPEEEVQQFAEWHDMLYRLFCEMTEGNNLHALFSRQLRRIEAAAVKEGVIDAFLSKEFKNKPVSETRIREVKKTVKDALNSVLDGCYYMKDRSVMAKRLYYGGASAEEIYMIGTYIAIHNTLKEELTKFKLPSDGAYHAASEVEEPVARIIDQEQQTDFVERMKLITKQSCWQYLSHLYIDIVNRKEDNDVPKLVQRYTVEGRLKWSKRNAQCKPCFEVMKCFGFYTKTRWNDYVRSDR